MSSRPSSFDMASELDAQSQQHAQNMQTHLREAIARAGGALAFDQFMEQALYAPGLGYYVSGNYKFGQAGDFVTAPELSPVFGRAIARQCAQVLAQLEAGDILEFGAGTGTMAGDILLQLAADDQLPTQYLILELSPELKARQQAHLTDILPAELRSRVQWLDRLPTHFQGVMLGNEVLDAMPVQRFRLASEALVEEAYVIQADSGFAWQWGAIQTPGLADAVAALQTPLPEGYVSEINLRLWPWLQAVAASLTQGALLLIDYGYSAAEYYAPARTGGTLICHFRHRAHDNPLILAGMQDITANVDFSAVASAAAQAGLDLAGYSTQAHFLIGCGLDALLAASDPGDVANHMATIQGVKQLTLPNAMGERFKAIGLTRGLDMPLRGFQVRDLRYQL